MMMKVFMTEMSNYCLKFVGFLQKKVEKKIVLELRLRNLATLRLIFSKIIFFY